jgi:uracil-DNA glycosylase family 4
MSTPLFSLNLDGVVTQPTAVNPINTEFPQVENETRIFIIGDCPGKTELEQSRPMVGTSGAVLRNLLSGVGISPMSCAYSYVSRYPIKYDKASAFPWNKPEVLDGVERLREDIVAAKPNLIILLGDVPLHVAGKPGESVSNWHGSLFNCNTHGSPCEGFKCLATYDPADVFSNYDWMPLLRLDLQRAFEESTTPELNLPVRHYELNLSAYEIITRLRNLPPAPIAVDIEGYVSWVSCISIATSPTNAFIIPFGVFSVEDDVRIIEQLRITMARVDLPKILQNCIYDYFVLAWKYQIHLANIIFDTMLSGWELYPELPKGLGTQTAIWTREPYYKFQRKIDHTVTHWKYCCTDSCVTYEIAERHMQAFTPTAQSHFSFNMGLLPAINYMQLRGMRFNKARADELYAATQVKQAEIQLRINIECGKAVNVNSPKQLSNILYNEKHFAKQHPKVGGRLDRTKLSTNIDALLELNRLYNTPLIRDLVAWRKCEKLMQTLAMPLSAKDGRIRCSYNLVGTDTGRLNCYSSAEQSEVYGKDKKPKDVGANLTTVTKKLRHLFCADEGHEFFQLDLAGADGWTVAAHCNRFGDPTMLDDYNRGIKPARVIAFMHLHGDISTLSRDELYRESKYIGNDHDPRNTQEVAALYFICKRVQHGTNYLLGPATMADQILKDSFKLTGTPLYVDSKMCIALQRLYNLRYKGVRAWQNWIESELKSKGKLNSASGHIRTFFGRRTAHETLRSAVAHEPQANTTYATNRALHNLWHDPENRNPNGSLIIEPLHHVHDALCGQWPIEQRDWSIKKLKTYFADTLTIARLQINIPFEGAYGPSWGECDTPI